MVSFLFPPQWCRSKARKLLVIGTFIAISIALFTSLRNSYNERIVNEAAKVNDRPWLNFPGIYGYYDGLRSLVPADQHAPEYPVVDKPEQHPNLKWSKPPTVEIPLSEHVPFPEHTSTAKHHDIEVCYLDIKETIKAPGIQSYKGLPLRLAQPVIGSYDVLGIKGDVCFDRLGRLGSYGLEQEDGSSEPGGDNPDNDPKVPINYDAIDSPIGMTWGRAQAQCLKKNQARFKPQKTPRETTPKGELLRTAVVIRAWVGYEWSPLSIINIRAMINEISLKSGGEYTVHILLHVKDANMEFWNNENLYQEIIRNNTPAEFQDIVTLWSQRAMEMYYATQFGDSFENSSGTEIYGAYRSLHMSLQWFAQRHPEYEFFWNWEMDVRSTGHYYELFDRISDWSRLQSRIGLTHRNAKYYIPALHGSWDDFAHQVDIANSGNSLIKTSDPGLLWPGAPQNFPGKKWLTGENRTMPKSCSDSIPAFCGVGEEADLITLNPIFNPDASGWILEKDITGYDTSLPIPPRRTAIVAVERLSKKLLQVMHDEMLQFGHSAFSEMFPPTMAFHHGLKAVFAPHPVFFDRKWPLEEVEKKFNGGTFGSSGGNASSPFNIENEHNFHGTTWYYSAAFSGVLWRRWLGFEEGGEGGRKYEERGTGRMCLPPMLLHPIKWEAL